MFLFQTITNLLIHLQCILSWRPLIQHIPVSTKIKTILNWLMRWNVGYWHRSSHKLTSLVSVKYRTVLYNYNLKKWLSRMTCKYEHCVSWQGQRQSIPTRFMYLTSAVAGYTSRTISHYKLIYGRPTHQCLLIGCFYYNSVFLYFIRTKEYSVINDPVLLNHCNS